MQSLLSARRSWLVVAVALAAGCAQETVVHGLVEKEANIVLEVLDQFEIPAQKLTNNTGREVLYDISVPASQRLDAIRVLNKHELPRRKDKGYVETFSEAGLIPTSSEEKAKRPAATEGEIERQIKLIEGILDVQVQLVMPDESALRTTKEQEPPTTASVTIKYLPGAGGARPVSEPEVQAIVAAGVEKLLPENVVVLMRPVGGVAQVGDTKPVAEKKGLEKLGHKRLSIGLITLLVLIALIGLGLVFSQMRLRTVRGRLIRLQNEIAKARRKPGDALSAPGQAAS